jgi:hypothetical protein
MNSLEDDEKLCHFHSRLEANSTARRSDCAWRTPAPILQLGDDHSRSSAGGEDETSFDDGEEGEPFGSLDDVGRDD